LPGVVVRSTTIVMSGPSTGNICGGIVFLFLFLWDRRVVRRQFLTVGLWGRDLGRVRLPVVVQSLVIAHGGRVGVYRLAGMHRGVGVHVVHSNFGRVGFERGTGQAAAHVVRVTVN